MFKKEQEHWNNIKTVRDYKQFLENQDLDVLGWNLHNRDLSKAGFWKAGHVNYDFDITPFLAQKPLIAPHQLSTKNRIPQEIELLKKTGMGNCYATHTINEDLEKIVLALGFEKGYSAYVQNQHPGNLLFRHADSLSVFINEQEDVLDQEYDKELKQPKGAKPVYRCLVALDDWHPGQIVNFEPDFWSHWKKGDVMFFDWRNSAHSTANVGIKDRPLMKITGTMTDASYVQRTRNGGSIKKFNILNN